MASLNKRQNDVFLTWQYLWCKRKRHNWYNGATIENGTIDKHWDATEG